MCVSVRDLPATVPAFGTLQCKVEVVGHRPGQHEYQFCLYSDANGLVVHKVLAKGNIVSKDPAPPKDSNK
jgi:hypothetical protein